MINKEHLIDSISSTPIEWKLKDLFFEKVSKQVKHKTTGETKTIEFTEPKRSFFNFFSNVRLPTTEEVDKVDYEVEKELGSYLDLEFEYGMEILEEFIPHALDYYVSLKTESDEFAKYSSQQHHND